MKKIFFINLLMCISLAVFSQSEENKEVPKLKYSNITEFGLASINFKGGSAEATSVSGIQVNGKHSIGLGYGFGGLKESVSNIDFLAAYIPFFANYRYYFYVKKFSPHVNIAAGARFFEKKTGIFASATYGFKVGHFSLSSGVSFMAVNVSYYSYDFIKYYYYQKNKWIYPVGMFLKVGFCF